MPGERETVSIGDMTYYKHPIHWYPDGNVIYLVEDTAINVFQSIITRRSRVLKEMMHIETSELWFRLEDLLRDFTFLLDVIMPQTCTKPRISTDNEWRSLIGLIQIAQRYEVDDVAARAAKVLEEMLPTVQHPDQNTNVYDDPESAVDVISFARRCHLPQFLRPAFYALATQEWADYPLEPNPLTRLSSKDMMRVQQGRIKLQSEVISMAFGRWENCNGQRCHDTCTKEGGCWGGWGDGFWPKEDDVARWKNLQWHPLDELKKREEMPQHRHVCTSCRDEFVAANKQMRVDLIDKLATFFNLGDDEAAIHGGA
ncbi:hypothetical protein M407DRAFT_31716 [Tulasnella calospora MUT 4182]|uniref:BTB domain-containing protein n=1 Tax=Tulasnella calospora MUT 4182 TaxID=1051891 RepID=A0A0C3PUT6_9AGAM|nr:hypothetical protein M407DRAFT_31716 [Tulasnella calospora MUT 4182]